MKLHPSGSPSLSGWSALGLTTLDESHPSAVELSVLLGINGAQLISLSSRCGLGLNDISFKHGYRNVHMCAIVTSLDLRYSFFK